MTARRVTVSPLRDFFHAETAGGIVLVVATITALVWANSPWKQSYFELWHTHLSIALGSHSVDLTLEQWVNEGLMTIFFLVVGLEIKRELVEGELRDPRTAVLPAIAAVGGMIVPALIYVAINVGGNGAGGWGIPMATDIAMAIGVVSLLGSRVPPSLKLFLLALAIVDDIGAIVVIAIFYSDSIHLVPLLVAFGFLLGGRWRALGRHPVRSRLRRARGGAVVGAPRRGRPHDTGRRHLGIDGADPALSSERARRRGSAARHLHSRDGRGDRDARS